MLEEALRNNRLDDRITLTRLPPSPDVTDKVAHRPRLGEDATFRCIVPAGVDWLAVSWLHQDRTVFQAGQLRPLPEEDTTGQRYRFTQVDNALILQVLNVTLRSGGSLHCITTPPGHTYSPRPRVLQSFLLLPLVTRRDEVFAPAADYLTATEGDHVKVMCSIRFPLPESIRVNMDNHIIWRRNGRIIHGPTEAPYGALLPRTGLFQLIPNDAASNRNEPPNSPGNVIRDTVEILGVTLADEGPLECFFRPHRELHEWVLQSTRLWVSVSSKN